MPFSTVYAPAEDLGHELTALLNGRRYGDTRILEPESVTAMFEPRTRVDEAKGYAMDWCTRSLVESVDPATCRCCWSTRGNGATATPTWPWFRTPGSGSLSSGPSREQAGCSLRFGQQHPASAEFTMRSHCLLSVPAPRPCHRRREIRRRAGGQSADASLRWPDQPGASREVCRTAMPRSVHDSSRVRPRACCTCCRCKRSGTRR